MSLMSRRALVVGAASLIAAPAIVRVSSLMPIRGGIVPVVLRVYFGFVDRLWADLRFRDGEVAVRGLEIVIENGVLTHHGLMPRRLPIGRSGPPG